MNSNDMAMAYGAVVNKAWSDEAFKSQLTSDPKGALKSLGFDLPADTDVEVVQGTASKIYIALPPQPGEMSMGALDDVAGGGSRGSAWAGSNSATSVTDSRLY